MEDYFKEGGVLSRHIENYKYRSQQVDMAQSVLEALKGENTLVVEAGTGTGKTFAYLLPALTLGEKVIISTGTKTLQDQLYSKDIPTILNAVEINSRVSLLKGRANYVCHHYLNRSKNQGRFRDKLDIKHLMRIDEFSTTSSSGDKSFCKDVPEDADIWNSVTSSRDNCLGSDCEHYQDCFVVKARMDAMMADIIVVNHHLFFADILLKDIGLTDLLPDSRAIIFDEAHLIPEIASIFFGDTISTNQLTELARDARGEVLETAGDDRELRDAVAQLELAIRSLIITHGVKKEKYTKAFYLSQKELSESYNELTLKFEALISLLDKRKERSEGLSSCLERASIFFEKLKTWANSDETEDFVSWAEVFLKTIHFNRTPLNIADTFKSHMEDRKNAWVFTSATLSVSGDFSHFTGQLGLDNSKTRSWESPYDYSKNALLYLPRDLPNPNQSNFTELVVKAAINQIKVAGGRTFFLFTSNAAMSKAAFLVEQELKLLGLPFPIYVQGQEPKSVILEKFRRDGNAILIGSMSFWEGVDVRGDSLSLVIIDRLPFGRPDDPVLKARVTRLRDRGLNAFTEYQLPKAVLTLKQGAGRLIRDESDTGVLMICDPRLVTKAYGRTIWRSLPPMKRTREISDVAKFFE